TYYGKIWNDGIFTGGRFIGNDFSSYNEYIFEKWDFGLPITNPRSTSIGGPSIVDNPFQGNLGQWVNKQCRDITAFGPSGFVSHPIKIEQKSSFNNSSLPYSLGITIPGKTAS